MPLYDWECKNEHIFEQSTAWDKQKIVCPQCGASAQRIWMAPASPHRQLSVPIVFWKYSDGTIGVAGRADAKTPKNAERVEARSAGDYRRLAKRMNEQLRSKEFRKEEDFLRQKEEIEKAHRSQLSHMMANESDPVAREIYRYALERGNSSGRPLSPGEFFSIAMEMDRSNYE